LRESDWVAISSDCVAKAHASSGLPCASASSPRARSRGMCQRQRNHTSPSRSAHARWRNSSARPWSPRCTACATPQAPPASRASPDASPGSPILSARSNSKSRCRSPSSPSRLSPEELVVAGPT
jgi:hypothetical protein